MVTIDYCERRLDGVIEAGDWLIDRAVEDAIARNDWTPPAPSVRELDIRAQRELDRAISYIRHRELLKTIEASRRMQRLSLFDGGLSAQQGPQPSPLETIFGGLGGVIPLRW